MERTNNLVDISTVKVDPNLSEDERLKEYARQLGGNPNNFMCCGYEVTASFAKKGRTLKDCLVSIVTEKI